jgi:tetratricopeptide (TPR) repeat protein
VNPTPSNQHWEALVIAKEIGNRPGEGNRPGNLENAYANLGQVDKVIEYHEKALAIAGEIKDPCIEQVASRKLKELSGKKRKRALLPEFRTGLTRIKEAFEGFHVAA